MQGFAKLTTFVLTMYKHLTREQRYVISALYAKGFSLTDIAKDIHVSVSISTVSREIRRNRSKRKYSAVIAQEYADIRKERLLHSNHAIKESIKKRVLDLLTAEQWSPKQISGWLKKDGVNISHETIYKWIRADKKSGGELYKHCRHKLKHQARPVGKWIPIKDRVPISARPIEADGTRFGDWEMDTIVGKDGKGAIVTLVERSTDYFMMKHLPQGKNAYELAQAVRWMLFPYRKHVLTITTDNGTEFAEHKLISKLLKTKIYFADPYASWQKGNIEHTNKLIRQYIPKGSDFDTLNEETIKQIQYKINRRPREKLNFMTPKECFFKQFY